MSFKEFPGRTGKFYVPPEQPARQKKHPCKDCFSCQMCDDDRCALCLKKKCCEDKKNPSQREG